MFDRKAYMKEYHASYYASHSEQAKERASAWYRTHPRRASERGRVYRLKHIDELKKKGRAYYLEHAEQIKERARAWRLAHPEINKETQRYWKQTPNGKEKIREYWKTPKMKEYRRKHQFARKNFGFIPLNEPFKFSHAHHIDREHIIYIPTELHRSIGHSVLSGRNMEDINRIAFEFMQSQVYKSYYEREVEK